MTTAWDKLERIEEGDLLSIADVARIFPGHSTKGGPISRWTVTRWIKRGIKGRRLPVRKLGAITVIHRRDLEAFIRDVVRPADGEACTCGTDPIEEFNRVAAECGGGR